MVGQASRAGVMLPIPTFVSLKASSPGIHFPNVKENAFDQYHTTFKPAFFTIMLLQTRKAGTQRFLFEPPTSYHFHGVVKRGTLEYPRRFFALFSPPPSLPSPIHLGVGEERAVEKVSSTKATYTVQSQIGGVNVSWLFNGLSDIFYYRRAKKQRASRWPLAFCVDIFFHVF